MEMKYLASKFTVCLCMFLLLIPASVFAHKVKIFASAEGNVISGYVYYTGGGKPKQALILVQDQHGNGLGELKTDGNGEFSFSAETRRDHIFILELADGHRASFTVKAEELPASLAEAESAEPQLQFANDTVERQKNVLPVSDVNSSVLEQKAFQLSAEELEAYLDMAIAKQLRPLREQLDRYEEKVRLHDILGGIGYIVGLMGLGYFLSARKTR